MEFTLERPVSTIYVCDSERDIKSNGLVDMEKVRGLKRDRPQPRMSSFRTTRSYAVAIDAVVLKKLRLPDTLTP